MEWVLLKADAHCRPYLWYRYGRCFSLLRTFHWSSHCRDRGEYSCSFGDMAVYRRPLGQCGRIWTNVHIQPACREKRVTPHPRQRPSDPRILSDIEIPSHICARMPNRDRPQLVDVPAAKLTQRRTNIVDQHVDEVGGAFFSQRA